METYEYTVNDIMFKFQNDAVVDGVAGVEGSFSRLCLEYTRKHKQGQVAHVRLNSTSVGLISSWEARQVDARNATLVATLRAFVTNLICTEAGFEFDPIKRLWDLAHNKLRSTSRSLPTLSVYTRSCRCSDRRHFELVLQGVFVLTVRISCAILLLVRRHSSHSSRSMPLDDISL